VLTRIWDVPVRLFHWAIVLLIPFSWWTAKNGLMEWHRLSGYAIFGLLLFRIAWGVFGSETARFANFVKGPQTVWRYVKALAPRTRARATIGHNPLGGWSVIALLGALVGQVGLGLIAVDTDGIESGPLSEYVSFDTGRLAAEMHHSLFDIILGLIALHLAAIAIHQTIFRHNLVGPMITGRGFVAQTAREPAPALLGRFVAAALASAALAWFVANGLRL
jgi:cytochrome b